MFNDIRETRESGISSNHLLSVGKNKSRVYSTRFATEGTKVAHLKARNYKQRPKRIGRDLYKYFKSRLFLNH